MGDFALVIPAFDYIIVDPTKRKYATYKEIGWDDMSISDYVNNKENHERIADFITNTVSFSASSRRNRFYDIYNRLDMLNLEEAYPGAIEGITHLSDHFETYIITDRTEDLQEDTIEHLKKLGFPKDKIHVFFKKTHDSMHNYKRTVLREISIKYPSGIGLVTHPKDAQILGLYEYSVIGFDSIIEEKEFSGQTEFVCHTWDQIRSSLENQ
ncbi:MAG: hypothetical protein EU530_07280 [Promethearchaeota archaeon]|nr:MAG: hypothetical protein EU530_07280 [Candidatus Lokiarchaeota archaeon]